MPVPSYLELLRVELCQEVPLLVVELDKLLGSPVADHRHKQVGSVQVVEEDKEWVETRDYNK